MITTHLDVLVRAGRITGYTIEESSRYLSAETPTLTYRMYSEGWESRLNLGEFSAAMAELASRLHLSRVWGTVVEGAVLRRSRQLCLAAEFPTARGLNGALEIVNRRFVAAPAAAAGSWRYPDVRVSGIEAADAESVYAHRWSCGGASAVVLALTAAPPVPGATTFRVKVLSPWLSLLAGTETNRPSATPQLAFSQ
jgi:hypothetical protein